LRDGEGKGVRTRHRAENSVRATRAYLAGFGTSGSLLAGAAVLFLLGSAIVAFNGWPQIGAGPVTSNVSAAPLAATSRASRRLTAALAVTHTRKTTRAPATRSRTAAASGHKRVALSGVGAGSVQSGGGGTGAGGPSSPAGTATGASSAAGSSPCSGCNSTPRSPATPVTTTVIHTVSHVGDYVGQQLTNVSDTAAQQVDAVSPPAGSVIRNTGSTLANTVTNTADTVTRTATAVTNTLAGLGGR